MKKFRKYAAIMLVAALVFGIFAGPSEVLAAKAPKYRPFIKERSVAITEGKSTKLTIKHAEEYKVTYQSEDKSVMRVSKTGKITGVKMGLTNLRVIFSVAGIGSKTYTIPVRVWKKPFVKLTKTRTIEPGMQCQLWISSNVGEGSWTNVDIMVKADSEAENVRLHTFAWEENPELFWYPGCPLMKQHVAVDKGYMSTTSREIKTGGRLYLQKPTKAVWIDNDGDTPVEVTFSVKTVKGEKNLRWFEFKDVEAGE